MLIFPRFISAQLEANEKPMHTLTPNDNIYYSKIFPNVYEYCVEFCRMVVVPGNLQICWD